MNFFEGQWIELFRTGTQTDSSGNSRIWTSNDLAKMVSKYNGQTDHEAPLVLGHPKDNAPAYGWLEELKTDGNTLYGKFKQVAKGMKEAVSSGLFKKRSIALYPDLMMRHVGFLGAVPPAVKGLANIAFKSEDEFIYINFEEGEKDEMTKELEQKLKDAEAALEKQKKEFEDAVAKQQKEFEEETLKLKDSEAALEKQKKEFEEENQKLKSQIEEAKKNENGEDPDSKFSEKEKALKAEREKLEKEQKEFQEQSDKRFKEIENKLKLEEKKNRLLEYKDFVGALHKEGKVVTDSQNDLIDLMESIHEVGSYKFSDGDKAPIDKLQDFLSKQPSIVNFNEIETSKQKKNGEKSSEEQLEEFAEKLMKEEKLSYAEALTRAQIENPNLAAEVAKTL